MSPCVDCCRDTVGAGEAQGAANTHASIKHLAAIRPVQYVTVGLADTVHLYGKSSGPDYSSAPAVAWILRDGGARRCPTPVIGERLLRVDTALSARSGRSVYGGDLDIAGVQPLDPGVQISRESDSAALGTRRVHQMADRVENFRNGFVMAIWLSL